MKNIKNSIFPILIALSALSVSASAAFYSISGLSKLFAGASFEVIIMASSLEVSKLVIASLLYQYWNSINKLLRTYLSIAAFVLVLITSMGIYGFLSAAYQETASKAGNIDAQVALVEVKRDNIKQQLEIYNKEKVSINDAVSELRSGLSNNKIQYKDQDGNIITSTSSATRKALETQLDQAIERQDKVNTKVDELNEQLFQYESEIVEINTNSELAGELGPLKYLSGLTGIPMDKIINYLLLVIIFVFDPLAISLVIAANFAFEKAFPKKKYKENLYGEKIEDKEDSLVWDNVLQDELVEEDFSEGVDLKEDPNNLPDLDLNESEWDIEDEETEDFEDQEYDLLDLDKDGIVSDDEIIMAQKLLQTLQNRLENPNISGWRRKKIKAQIEQLKAKLLDEDDLTKTY